jgi:preprotein translocase subunit SecG
VLWVVVLVVLVLVLVQRVNKAGRGREMGHGVNGWSEGWVGCE